MTRLLLVDNVDSFTFMLADVLAQAGATVTVERCEAVGVERALDDRFDGVVLSPGPGRPEQSGALVAIAGACIAARRPLLGVCLGHQAIALACGARVERFAPVHGKVSAIRHDSSGLFAGLPAAVEATRYHSLGVAGLRPPLVANAWTGAGVIMGLRHESAPAHGVQFHPESVASTHGIDLLRAFVRLAANPA